MENEKKPSRFGVRLSAIIVAVILVVCMAVPAFAAVSATYPADAPPLPDNDHEWMIIKRTGYSGYFLVDITEINYFSYMTFAAETNGWYVSTGNGSSGRKVVDQYSSQDGHWVFYRKSSLVADQGTVGWRDIIVYSTKWVTSPADGYIIKFEVGGSFPPYTYSDIEGYSYFIYRSGDRFYCVRTKQPNEVYVQYDESGAPYIYSRVENLSYRTYAGYVGGSWATSASGRPGSNIVYSTFPISDGEGGQFYPPYFPPIKQVGGVLTVVVEWVGSVVSAVVSGPMSGLLILLAVPVAITLLLVAFIVIRRIIWGA